MIERECPCKVNLLLHVLGKRPDGFHELETVLRPVAGRRLPRIGCSIFFAGPSRAGDGPRRKDCAPGMFPRAAGNFYPAGPSGVWSVDPLGLRSAGPGFRGLGAAWPGAATGGAAP